MAPLTRREIAGGLENLEFPPLSRADIVTGEQLIVAAAAELRKVCGNCKHFTERPIETMHPIPWCLKHGIIVPAAGSGFCHRWEGK